MDAFEPQIVGFACHYCAYTAADTAGTQRMEYPANVKIIRVPCSGKVDAIHLLRAFELGADGVYVAGCLEGDCHFKNGNVRAAEHVESVQQTLEILGLEPERLAMVRMSAGMGDRFAAFAQEMTDKIRSLGPSPIASPASAGEPAKAAR